MKTVKELSDLTGVSVRALHYYDEIGLLKATKKSEAGYRLYDEQALERLRQILFYRELDLPLKDIQAFLDDPAMDKEKTLRMQKRMLEMKKRRLERLIASIDDILNGEDKLDFAIFSDREIEELFDSMIENMPEDLKEIALQEFGGLDAWRTHYTEVLSRRDMQKSYQKVVEWYGGKEAYLNAARKPLSHEVVESYEQRIEHVLDKLAAKRDCPVDAFEVKELIGEYGFVARQLYQLKDEKGIMLAIAVSYRRDRLRTQTDERYGKGASDFFADAIEAFYRD